MAMCEVYLTVPVPEALAARLRLKAERECSSVAGTARRLIALGVAQDPDVIHRPSATSTSSAAGDEG